MRLSLLLVLSVVLALAAVQYSRLTGNRQSGVFELDPPTPYFHYSPMVPSRGRVLVVHGLNGNKSLLNALSFALADAGFEVYSIDLPGHGASHASFNAVRAQETVGHVLDQLGVETAVVGHSLGGGLLLDVANDRGIGNMVLFSPAPTSLSQIRAARVLLFVGQFDLPPIRTFVTPVAGAVTGSFEFHDLPWTGHSGAPGNPEVIAQVAEWLGGDAHALQTRQRLSWLLLMFLCSLGLGIVLLGKPETSPRAVALARPVRESIVYYVGAAVGAAVILRFIPIAGWLQLFVTDYLIGFIFLTGSALCLAHILGRPTRRPILIAVAAAAYVIAIPGFAVASEFTQLTLSASRWWRFVCITLMGFPLLLADEILLRPIRSRWNAFLTALLTRTILGVIAVTAALLWNRDAVFLLMIIHMIVIFWMALWFAGGFIYRRTHDPFAAALFMSLVQAWLFASLFVAT